MQGQICLSPLEFLALTALPLSAVSARLKQFITRRFSGPEDEA